MQTSREIYCGYLDMEMSLVSEFRTKRITKQSIFLRGYTKQVVAIKLMFQLSDSYHIIVTSYISSMLVRNTGPIKKKRKGPQQSVNQTFLIKDNILYITYRYLRLL